MYINLFGLFRNYCVSSFITGLISSCPSNSESIKLYFLCVNEEKQGGLGVKKLSVYYGMKDSFCMTDCSLLDRSI